MASDEHEFATWAKSNGLGPVISCPHAPFLVHLVALDQSAPAETFFELDVNRRKVFLGSTLFLPADLRPLARVNDEGFRRLRPGAEGLLKLVHNGTKRRGRQNEEGLKTKRIPELLAEDWEGVEQAALLFKSGRSAVLDSARAVVEGELGPKCGGARGSVVSRSRAQGARCGRGTASLPSQQEEVSGAARGLRIETLRGARSRAVARGGRGDSRDPVVTGSPRTHARQGRRGGGAHASAWRGADLVGRRRLRARRGADTRRRRPLRARREPARCATGSAELCGKPEIRRAWISGARERRRCVHRRLRASPLLTAGRARPAVAWGQLAHSCDAYGAWHRV